MCADIPLQTMPIKLYEAEDAHKSDLMEYTFPSLIDSEGGQSI